MQNAQTQHNMTWSVSGMHSSSCSILIDEAAEDIDGPAASSTSLKKKLATATFDSTRCDADQIDVAIVEAGHQAARRPLTRPPNGGPRSVVGPHDPSITGRADHAGPGHADALAMVDVRDPRVLHAGTAAAILGVRTCR